MVAILNISGYWHVFTTLVTCTGATTHFVSSIELDATAVCCSWESFRLDSLVTQPLGTKNAPSLVETSTRAVAAHPLGD